MMKRYVQAIPLLYIGWVNMTILRAVLFDMDGVLIDSLHQHRESWNQYCTRFNIAIAQEKFDKEYFTLRYFYQRVCRV